jgi:hypothetical protein
MVELPCVIHSLLNIEPCSGFERRTMLVFSTTTDVFSAMPSRLYYALAVLYYSTRGERWSLSRFWLTCANECDWYLEGTGIQSCHADGNIITIALAENNLDGPLPRELALLSRSLGEYRALTLARFSDIIKEQQNSLKQ